MKEKKGTIYEHLTELRRVFVISIAAFVICTLLCYFLWRHELVGLVFNPIRKIGTNIVIIGVTEGFMIQLKLCCVAGLLMASPVILSQIIYFILPALYKKEKKILFFFLFFSIVLFCLGVLLGYYFVLGIGLRVFLVDYNQEFGTMIAAGKYVTFFNGFLLPFGITFQFPLLSFALTKMGILNPAKLRKKRGYAILLIFVVAAIVTPPDVVSQVLLSLPMMVLYEVSIGASYIAGRKEIVHEE